MKITRRTEVGTADLTSGVQGPMPADPGTQQEPQRKVDDSVSLSEQARLLNGLKSKAASESTSSERVAALRKAVEEGSFSPNTRAVAKSFVRELLAYFVR